MFCLERTVTRKPKQLITSQKPILHDFRCLVSFLCMSLILIGIIEIWFLWIYVNIWSMSPFNGITLIVDSSWHWNVTYLNDSNTNHLSKMKYRVAQSRKHLRLKEIQNMRNMLTHDLGFWLLIMRQCISKETLRIYGKSNLYFLAVYERCVVGIAAFC